jgi:hypothetical protein
VLRARFFFGLALVALVLPACPEPAAPTPPTPRAPRVAEPAPIELVESFPVETSLDHLDIPDAADVWPAMFRLATERRPARDLAGREPQAGAPARRAVGIAGDDRPHRRRPALG